MVPKVNSCAFILLNLRTLFLIYYHDQITVIVLTIDGNERYVLFPVHLGRISLLWPDGTEMVINQKT